MEKEDHPSRKLNVNVNISQTCY